MSLDLARRFALTGKFNTDAQIKRTNPTNSCYPLKPVKVDINYLYGGGRFRNFLGTRRRKFFT